MSFILFLSEAMVPLILFYIVGFGILSKRPVFDDFINGAKDGMKTVAGIMPTPVSYTHLKIQIQEEITTMTAAKQFEQKIMNLIPFFLVLYVDVSSPGFFDMMYQTSAGRGIMTGCLVLYAAAYGLAGRILRIEVDVYKRQRFNCGGGLL